MTSIIYFVTQTITRGLDTSLNDSNKNGFHKQKRSNISYVTVKTNQMQGKQKLMTNHKIIILLPIAIPFLVKANPYLNAIYTFLTTL